MTSMVRDKGLPPELAGPRELSYIRPARRRLTEYEAVTCHIQPSAHAGGLQAAGDFQMRPDGRPPYDEEATRLKMADWYAFRDPNQMWQRPYYSGQAEAEKTIERTTQVVIATNGSTAMGLRWLSEGLLGAYLPYGHVEHGLFRTLNIAARESLSDTLNSVLMFNAADKLRHAQAIAIYGSDLEGALAGFDAAPARAAWLEGHEWQDLRRLVEHIMTLRDWCEIITAINLAFEPLLGEPLRRHVFTMAAAAHRDIITPTIATTATADWLRNRTWSAAFASFVASDADNHRIVGDWQRSWGERVRAVAGPLLANLEKRLAEPGLAAACVRTGDTELASLQSWQRLNATR